jgi:hypothetical protein
MRLTNQPSATVGSVLLLCIALVAAASMVAFTFAVTAQSGAAAGEVAVHQELARSAARMGARHAMQVTVERLLDSAVPYANADWALRDFGNLERDDPANKYPSGSMVACSAASLDWSNGAAATLSPHALSTTEDNVQPDARMNLLHHQWSGDFALLSNSGANCYIVMGSHQPYGPWSSPNPSSVVYHYNPCNPRWIEPGYYNANGLTAPVRFTQVPGAAPATNAPVYFDERWRPVANREQARYRLRYAVAPIDLGGHLVWGRQLNFTDTDVSAAAFTAPAATPHEWDESTARAYLQSFAALIGAGGVGDAYGASNTTTSGTFDAQRSSVQLAFLGRGYNVMNSGGTNVPGSLLAGFAPGSPPVLKQLTDLGIVLAPGVEGAYKVPVSGAYMSAIATGGPPSWASAFSANFGRDFSYGGTWNLSPFGRANVFKAVPSRYYEGYTSCPWRINLLTATPDTVYYMITAYAPGVIFRKRLANFRRDVLDTSTNTVTSTTNNATYGGANDLRTAAFKPTELVDSPFKDFTGVTAPVVASAGVYDSLYPGPAADWEDYAAVEQDYTKRANPGSTATSEIHQLMLGSQVNVYHRPDAGAAWTAAAALDMTSVMNDGATALNLDGTATRWCGRPFDPMRGQVSITAFGDDTMMGQLSIYPGPSTKHVYWDGVGTIASMTNGTTGVPPVHRDSYWYDLITAFGEAVALTRALHLEAAWVGPASIPVYQAALTAQSKPTTIREVDRLFLSILGEWFPGDANYPGEVTTSKPGLVMVAKGASGQPLVRAQAPRHIIDFTCSANIRKIRDFLVTGGPALSAAVADRKAANMERVLNDMRMSFLGASGDYPDFRPLDFDGDGYAVCSGYTSTHPTVVLSNGKSIPAASAVAGVGPPPNVRFSLTGFLAFDKVRFVRALVRGQVWDELRQQPVDEANLDSVFAVDPDGNAQVLANGTVTGLEDNATLYMRWLRNLYQKYVPRTTN